jgi:serine protease AprX
MLISTPEKAMAVKSALVGIDDQGKLDEGTLRRFVFRTFGRARRTQDSPVMPDVWLRYIRLVEKIANARVEGSNPPNGVVDLLLTPWSGDSPGDIASKLRERLKRRDAEKLTAGQMGGQRFNSARVALSESRVVACVDFETLVRDVVPLTGWWKGLFQKKKGANIVTEKFDVVIKRIEEKKPSGTDFELFRYAALVGFIDSLLNANSREEIERLAKVAHQLGPPQDETATEQEEEQEGEQVGEYEVPADIRERAKKIMRPDNNAVAGDRKGIFLISLNRRASQSLFESRATVKADAANRVFEINTAGIVFAVIDGGIDATHPAFLKRYDENVKKLLDDRVKFSNDMCLKWSRVIETYDFTILRDIIAHAEDLRDIKKNPDNPALKRLPDAIKVLAIENETAFTHLAIRSDNQRDLDWEIVSPLIRIRQERLLDENSNGGRKKRKKAETRKETDVQPYLVPATDHGTHVAGILAANLPKDEDFDRPIIGMCPHLSLYDLRVFDAKGHGDEFAILCALEFVGWRNRDRSNPVVHGVNLSLALAHDVDSFACGQTPICEACNHLVGAGTVVVAAAGNTGFEGGAGTERQSFGSGYRPISITDPGNADYVITVGSTHRRDPHLYGVSYFSARGPTGDGRRKPDILAPGEKITSTIPGGRSQRMDGTSMAAPHVAGAAAMLMARYPELIGRPLQIKEILMRAATDLKREPSFQGAGLVDVLRALQSV